MKAFLEGCGFAVKGEIVCCDLVGVKGDGATLLVIGALKMTINLELVLRGIDRTVTCDEAWLAARLSHRSKGREGDARFRNLCRWLGFGLLCVSKSGVVEILVSPVAPMPRKDAARRSRLVEEQRRRWGDPVEGGGSRAPIMTAYRQQALDCAAALADRPGRPPRFEGEVPRRAPDPAR